MPGAARACFGALVPDRLHLVASASPDPVLLEVQVELASLGHDVDPGGDRVVAHRQQPRSNAEPRGDLAGHLGQRRAGREPVRAEQVGREVEIAEVEPGHVGVEGPELLGRAEGLVPPSPSALSVERVPQPVGDRVQIGRDVEPVHLDVVRGVHDHRDVRGRHGADQPAEELPRADPTGERRDPHVASVWALRRARCNRSPVIRSARHAPVARARHRPRRRPGGERQDPVRRRGGGAAAGARRPTARTHAGRVPSACARSRDDGHLLAQGLHPAHDAVSGPLSLLHVRQAPGQARSPVPVARGGRGDRRGRPAARVQGGAVHPRRPARGTLRGRAHVARGARVSPRRSTTCARSRSG